MSPQQITFLIFYILCFELIAINSGSTLWKLNSDQTKIIDGTEIHSKVTLFEVDISDKELLDIISSTVFYGDTWLKHENKKSLGYSQHFLEEDKQNNDSTNSVEKFNATCITVKANSKEMTTFELKPSDKLTNTEETLFDCGIPINFTHYDTLMGVYNRHLLPNVTNPQSASVFGYHTTSDNENEESTLIIDFSAYVKFLVQCIKKARQQKPHTAPLYNFLGNYWQLKGYSLKSIECFRRGLSISPHNARILLNLARLLFSLQYLDDAIYLTKRSLEVEQIQNGVWIHHFTLGEIFKAYGLYQEATVHLNHSLKLKPDLRIARLILQQINGMDFSNEIHINTIFIIIFLALLVLAIIILRHNIQFDIPRERHLMQITDGSARYFRNFRRNHKPRRPST